MYVGGILLLLSVAFNYCAIPKSSHSFHVVPEHGIMFKKQCETLVKAKGNEEKMQMK